MPPYLGNPRGPRQTTIGGPKFAALSNAWLAYVATCSDRSKSVHRLHQKYTTRTFSTRLDTEFLYTGLLIGKFVYIAPNHISIADSKELGVVWGHGSGTPKSDFYDAFVSLRPSWFTGESASAFDSCIRLI